MLLSVNVKARKPFALLTKTLLASFEEPGAKTKNYNPMPYSFPAEFRDHELDLTAASWWQWLALRIDESKHMLQ